MSELDTVKAELTEKFHSELDGMKAELSEKVHNENVKCYRNIQTLIEELDKKMDGSVREERGIKTAKGYFGGLIVLSLINIAGIIVVIANMFGLF